MKVVNKNTEVVHSRLSEFTLCLLHVVSFRFMQRVCVVQGDPAGEAKRQCTAHSWTEVTAVTGS